MEKSLMELTELPLNGSAKAVQVYLDVNACFILKIGNDKLNRNFTMQKN
jgi:hypothetical protein